MAIQSGAPHGLEIAKLLGGYRTPISLWFMERITKINGVYKTYDAILGVGNGWDTLTHPLTDFQVLQHLVPHDRSGNDWRFLRRYAVPRNARVFRNRVVPRLLGL